MGGDHQAVEDFFALADPFEQINGRILQHGGYDAVIVHPEGAGEEVAIEWNTVIGKCADPGLVMHFGAIDQGAIQIPQDGKWLERIGNQLPRSVQGRLVTLGRFLHQGEGVAGGVFEESHPQVVIFHRGNQVRLVDEGDLAG